MFRRKKRGVSGTGKNVSIVASCYCVHLDPLLIHEARGLFLRFKSAGYRIFMYDVWLMTAEFIAKVRIVQTYGLEKKNHTRNFDMPFAMLHPLLVSSIGHFWLN